MYAGHGISTRRNQCFKLLCASVSFSILCAKLVIPTFGSRHMGRLHTANDATTTTTTITLMMAALLTYMYVHTLRESQRERILNMNGICTWFHSDRRDMMGFLSISVHPLCGVLFRVYKYVVGSLLRKRPALSNDDFTIFIQ